MFSRIWTKPSTKSRSEQLERLQTALQDCDAVMIGAGDGLSTAAGFVYEVLALIFSHSHADMIG